MKYGAVMRLSFLSVVLISGTICAAGAYAGDLFGPVPETVQRAETGLRLGAGAMIQDYKEKIDGSVVDKESGTVPAFTLEQTVLGNHLGASNTFHVIFGDDKYEGAVQYCSVNQCYYTPLSTQTSNFIFNDEVAVRAGFSPITHVAVIPELIGGFHLWKRTIKGQYGFDELYLHGYYGGGLELDYTFANFVIGANIKGGWTAFPRLTADLASNTFHLGTRGWMSEGVRITWITAQHFRIYAGYRHHTFAYGRSPSYPANGGLTIHEPDSQTAQDTFEAGIIIF